MTLRGANDLSDETLLELLRRRLGRAYRAEPECAELAAVSLALSSNGSTEDLAAANAHLRQCSACADAVREWQAATRPLKTDSVAPRPWSLLALPRGLAFGIASLLVLVTSTLVWRSYHFIEVDEAHQLLAKGAGDALAVAVQRGERRLFLAPDQTMQDGDRLGFFYSADIPGYLALLSISGNDQATVLYPIGATQSASIATGKKVALPDGGVFIKRTKCEWLVGVFSEKPLVLARLLLAAKQAALLSSPECVLPLTIAEARTVVILR